MPTKIKSKVVSRHKPKKTYKSKPKSKPKSKSKAKPKKHSKHSKHSKKNAIYTPPTASPITINNQHHQQNIIDLITKFSQASKNVTKSQSNLPARLMKTRNVGSVRGMTSMNNMRNMQKPQSYSKSVSSSYSTVMNNGHIHSEGKKVINDSTKPFVQIDELHNGHVDHYMVPRNTISNMPKQMSTSMLIPTPMSTPLPTVKIIKITSMYPIKKSTNKSKKLKNTKRK